MSAVMGDPRNNLVVVGEGNGRVFKFDSVFSPGAPQQEVFDSCVRDLVQSLMDGFNGTVLAYGQTGAVLGACPCPLLPLGMCLVSRCPASIGSGKTYTMGTGAISTDLIRAADPDLPQADDAGYETPLDEVSMDPSTNQWNEKEEGIPAPGGKGSWAHGPQPDRPSFRSLWLSSGRSGWGR